MRSIKIFVDISIVQLFLLYLIGAIYFTVYVKCERADFRVHRSVIILQKKKKTWRKLPLSLIETMNKEIESNHWRTISDLRNLWAASILNSKSVLSTHHTYQTMIERFHFICVLIAFVWHVASSFRIHIHIQYSRTLLIIISFHIFFLFMRAHAIVLCAFILIEQVFILHV